MLLELTVHDAAFLVNTVHPSTEWEADTTLSDMFYAPGDGRGGGARLRLKLYAAWMAARRNPQATIRVDFTPAELWAIDFNLFRYDLSNPGAAPLVALMDKLWTLLASYHVDSLPENLRTVAGPPLKGLPITDEQRERLGSYDRLLKGDE